MKIQKKNIKIILVCVIALTLISLLTTAYFISSGVVKLMTNSQAATSVTLSIDASKNVYPFTHGMLGQGFVNWEFAEGWGKSFIGEKEGLTEAMNLLKPGIIRYAGGLWANSVGFDRTNPQRAPYTEWYKPGNSNPYYFHYSTQEIDSLAKFAKAIGSDVMIQVNISNNDPSMWADMVRYANVEKKYGFKYWELGNELDFDVDNKISADEYSVRLKSYITAMTAVDPTIKFQGAAVAAAIEPTGQNSTLSDFLSKPVKAAAELGQQLDVTFHWYQTCTLSNAVEDVSNYQFYDSPGVPIDSKVWNNSYGRKWADIIPSRIRKEAIPQSPNLRIGISEINANACENPVNSQFITALWFGDVLGRLAYNSVDFINAFEGYGEQEYALVSPSGLRPSYYAFLMYAKYFGTQMVSSSSTNNDALSVWASTDKNDPGKLKLMVTNISGQDLSTGLNISGFNGKTGKMYQLKGSSPTGTTANINGVSAQGLNVSSLNSIPSLPIDLSSSTYTFPAYSVTAIVLDGSGTQPTNTIAPNPTATNVPATSTPVVTVPVTTALPTNTIKPTTSTSSTPVISTVPLTRTITPMPTTSSVPTSTTSVDTTNTIVPTVTPTVSFSTAFTPAPTSTLMPTTYPTSGSTSYPTLTPTPSATAVPIIVNNTNVPPDVTTVVDNSSANLSGQSTPNSEVTVSVNNNNYSVITNSNGSWSKKVNLSSGTNNVKVVDSTGTKNYVLSVSSSLPNTGNFENILFSTGIAVTFIAIGYLLLRKRKQTVIN